MGTCAISSFSELRRCAGLREDDDTEYREYYATHEVEVKKFCYIIFRIVRRLCCAEPRRLPTPSIFSERRRRLLIECRLIALILLRFIASTTSRDDIDAFSRLPAIKAPGYVSQPHDHAAMRHRLKQPVVVFTIYAAH